MEYKPYYCKLRYPFLQDISTEKFCLTLGVNKFSRLKEQKHLIKLPKNKIYKVIFTTQWIQGHSCATNQRNTNIKTIKIKYHKCIPILLFQCLYLIFNRLLTNSNSNCKFPFRKSFFEESHIYKSPSFGNPFFPYTTLL